MSAASPRASNGEVLTRAALVQLAVSLANAIRTSNVPEALAQDLHIFLPNVRTLGYALLLAHCPCLIKLYAQHRWL